MSFLGFIKTAEIDSKAITLKHLNERCFEVLGYAKQLVDKQVLEQVAPDNFRVKNKHVNYIFRICERINQTLDFLLQDIQTVSSTNDADKIGDINLSLSKHYSSIGSIGDYVRSLTDLKLSASRFLQEVDRLVALFYQQNPNTNQIADLKQQWSQFVVSNCHEKNLAAVVELGYKELAKKIMSDTFSVKLSTGQMVMPGTRDVGIMPGQFESAGNCGITLDYSALNGSGDVKTNQADDKPRKRISRRQKKKKISRAFPTYDYIDDQYSQSSEYPKYDVQRYDAFNAMCCEDGMVDDDEEEDVIEATEDVTDDTTQIQNEGVIRRNMDY